MSTTSRSPDGSAATPPYAIYTVATAQYATYARILAKSLRDQGSRARFFAFTDGRPVPEASVCRTLPWDYRRRAKFSPERWWIKFYLLNELAREVDGYLVFMDADIYARRPVDLSPLLTGTACAFLEIDLTTLPDTDWFGLTCGEVVDGLRELGYDGPAFSLNGGLFAVRSDAIPEFLAHVYRSRRLFRNEQHALVYALGCMNPAPPMIDDHRDLYDSNTIGADLIPSILDGNGWDAHDWLSGKPISVDPALVHFASQKRAFCEMLAPGLAPLSLPDRLADRRARATSRTFAQPLKALGLWHEIDPSSVPVRASEGLESAAREGEQSG